MAVSNSPRNGVEVPSADAVVAVSCNNWLPVFSACFVRAAVTTLASIPRLVNSDATASNCPGGDSNRSSSCCCAVVIVVNSLLLSSVWCVCVCFGCCCCGHSVAPVVLSVLEIGLKRFIGQRDILGQDDTSGTIQFHPEGQNNTDEKNKTT